jgi:N utilization substance protein B
MGSRRKAREAAVQMLYQMDLADMEADVAMDAFWANLEGSPEGKEFANDLVRGYGEEQQAVDDAIRGVSQHWRLERMSRVDRNIIRLAAYELMRLPDIPPNVTLNEAVELAKRFGNEESPAFVNGVLDKLASELAAG